jgi:hypothetical protein
VGLACLYPFYAIGGMGGGDVKMLAAVGRLGALLHHDLGLLPVGHHRRPDGRPDDRIQQVGCQALPPIFRDFE